MSGSRRDCFDWPERPQLRCVPAPTAQDAGAARPGGEGLATLLTLAALPLSAYGLVYSASLLIDLLNRMPLLGVIACVSLIFGGAFAYALCGASAKPTPWRIESDEHVVCLPSGLYGVSYE